MTKLPSKGLIITIGCPGAGKSTWADSNLTPDTLRLERDRFRECLFGSRRAYHESAIPGPERSHVVTSAMLGAMATWPHLRWAVTDTGIAYERVLPFILECLATDNTLPVTLVVFNRSEEYLKHVNATRPVEHRIPDDILQKTITLFNSPDAWWRDAGLTIIEVAQP